MEKILAILSAQEVHTAFIDFACYLSKETGSSITGIFIESPYERSTAESQLELEKLREGKEGTGGQTIKDVMSLVAQNMLVFKDRCLANQVLFEIHENLGEPIQEALEESRYADLIVVDPKTNRYEEEDDLPSHFVKHLLSNAACPVVLAPDNFETVDELIFCYDGSDSSLFAIKQFTYLFPRLNERKALLLEIHHRHTETPFEGHMRIIEWFHAHYPVFRHQKLVGNVHDELFLNLLGRSRKFIIMGGYGRSVLRNFFRRNEANILSRVIDLPLFITHY